MDMKRRNAFIFQYWCSCSGWLIDPVCCSTWGRSLRGAWGGVTSPQRSCYYSSISQQGSLFNHMWWAVNCAAESSTRYHKTTQMSFTYIFTVVTGHLLVRSMKKMLGFASKSSVCVRARMCGCISWPSLLSRGRRQAGGGVSALMKWKSACFVKI